MEDERRRSLNLRDVVQRNKETGKFFSSKLTEEDIREWLEALFKEKDTTERYVQIMTVGEYQEYLEKNKDSFELPDYSIETLRLTPEEIKDRYNVDIEIKKND